MNKIFFSFKKSSRTVKHTHSFDATLRWHPSFFLRKMRERLVNICWKFVLLAKSSWETVFCWLVGWLVVVEKLPLSWRSKLAWIRENSWVCIKLIHFLLFYSCFKKKESSSSKCLRRGQNSAPVFWTLSLDHIIYFWSLSHRLWIIVSKR